MFWRMNLFQLRLPPPNPSELCGDSVRATRSEDRFQVGAKFSVLVQTGPKANNVKCQLEATR